MIEKNDEKKNGKPHVFNCGLYELITVFPFMFAAFKTKKIARLSDYLFIPTSIVSHIF